MKVVNLMKNKWYNTNILEKVFWDFPIFIGGLVFLSPFLYILGLVCNGIYVDLCSQGLW